jgi:hypothetical protein
MTVDGGEWPPSRPGRFTSGERAQVPTGRPQNNSERGREKIKCLLFPEIEPMAVQSAANHYTDCRKQKFQFTLEWFVHKSKERTAKH